MAEAGGQEFKAILQLYSKVKARKVYLKPYLKKIKIKIKVKKKKKWLFFYLYQRGRRGSTGWCYPTTQIPPSTPQALGETSLFLDSIPTMH